MTTLRIEHAIHDYDQWKSVFDGFAGIRAEAGVRSHVIRRPLGRPHDLLLDLEFDTPEAAAAFGEFLERRVWSSPETAPALAGTPRVRLLERMDVDQR